jgi:hypothetical protein
MVVKSIIDKDGRRLVWHEPPYSKEKEAEFYRRNGSLVAIARGRLQCALPNTTKKIRANRRADRRRSRDSQAGT